MKRIARPGARAYGDAVELRALAAGVFSFAAWLGACSSEEASGTSGTGAGGDGGRGSSTTSTTTATLGTTTCDDIGVCVDGAELGCEACAVSAEGSCGAQKQACDEEPTDACNLLDACHKACPPDDPFSVDVDEHLLCTQPCDAMYPAGVMLLTALRGCVYCGECPLSCPTESAMCVTELQ